MKKTICAVLILALILGVLSGYGGDGQTSSDLAAYKVNYTIEEENALSDFNMDRVYALDAENVKIMPEELQKASDYLSKYILNAAKNSSAFDINIGGVQFADDITNWTQKTETVSDADDKTEYKLTYTKSGQVLAVSVSATLYKAYDERLLSVIPVYRR